MKNYQNILWLEDGDTLDKQAPRNLAARLQSAGKSHIDHSSLKAQYFGELASTVDLKKRYLDALTTLSGTCDGYDLIVFDLDFRNDEDIKQDSAAFQDILRILEAGHVKPSEQNRGAEAFMRIAGYYLYLYLAMKGFPTNRMVILTGNSGNYQGQDASHPEICLKGGTDIIEKSSSNEWIERYYVKDGTDDTSHYYRIRRLVFQACNYWEEQLQDDDKLGQSNNIPFNILYYSKIKNERRISKSSAIEPLTFINLLEHIKMLFPVMCPANPTKVYYQAMHSLAAYHEASAKIQDIGKIDRQLVKPEDLKKDFSELKQFHSCIRNFRNWSSHNLLHTELAPDRFALLFCIALRTYFSWKNNASLNESLLPYEEIYGFESNNSKNLSLFSILTTAWNQVHEKLNNKNNNTKRLVYYSDLDEAIRELGKIEKCGNMDQYLFIPLWHMDETTVETTSEKKNGSATTSSGIYVTFELKKKGCDSLFGKTNPNTDDKKTVKNIFMHYCYDWLLKE